jgi:hypothetical protein
MQGGKKYNIIFGQKSTETKSFSGEKVLPIIKKGRAWKRIIMRINGRRGGKIYRSILADSNGLKKKNRSYYSGSSFSRLKSE